MVGLFFFPLVSHSSTLTLLYPPIQFYFPLLYLNTPLNTRRAIMAKILGIVRVELLLLQEEASDAMYVHHIPMMDNATALDIVSKILTILDRYNLSQDIVKPSSLLLKFNEGFPLEHKNKIKALFTFVP